MALVEGRYTHLGCLLPPDASIGWSPSRTFAEAPQVYACADCGGSVVVETDSGLPRAAREKHDRWHADRESSSR
jgi:hypothetical protein